MKRLDTDYKVPEGFEPILNYPDGVNGIPVVGEAKLQVHEGYRGDFVFDIETKVPALPLRGNGLLWSTGWDIPTRWAIDAEGRCWMDNAHGHPLEVVDPKALIGDAEQESDKNHIRKLLGMEIPMPEWQRLAIAAGWTPPTK
jgi:hypothetical protein